MQGTKKKYYLKQSKNNCIPVIQEFKRLKDAKAELYKIAEYISGYWITKDGWICEIYKK